GQRDLRTVGEMLLRELAPLVNAQQGVVYILDDREETPHVEQLASYADPDDSGTPRRFRLGTGLAGQCAATRQRLLLANIPEDLIHVRGGLITARPRTVIALPVLYEGQVKAVIELASVQEFTTSHLSF